MGSPAFSRGMKGKLRGDGLPASGECPGSQQEPEHWVDDRGVIQCDVIVEGPLVIVPQPPVEHDLQGTTV